MQPSPAMFTKFYETYKLPVICFHEMTTKKNCPKRAVPAVINTILSLIAAVVERQSTGLSHLSGFKSSQKEKTTSPERNLSFLYCFDTIDVRASGRRWRDLIYIFLPFWKKNYGVAAVETSDTLSPSFSLPVYSPPDRNRKARDFPTD